jgi:hypothetical protein
MWMFIDGELHAFGDLYITESGDISSVVDALGGVFQLRALMILDCMEV